MLFRTLLNRCNTKPFILLMLGLCSCGFHLHSLPLGNLGTSAAVLYSVDNAKHRVLRYLPNEMGTANLDSAINLPAELTATLVTTGADGNIYIGGYTKDANRSEVLVYDAKASDNDSPLKTVKLAAGRLTALAVDRQNLIYAAQQKAATTIYIYSGNIYSGNSGDGIPVRTIDPSFAELNDLAVDAGGNVYASGWNSGTFFIREFAATATGTATAIRTVKAPKGSAFGGLAVDDDGTLFVMKDQTICELAAGDTGTPKHVQAINLPARFTAYTSEGATNVLRRDGLGEFFVPVTMTGDSGSANMVYGFAANAAGDATPILQFTAPDATGQRAQNIPLAIF